MKTKPTKPTKKTVTTNSKNSTGIKNKLLFLFLISLLVTLSVSFGIHFLLFRVFYLNFVETRLFATFGTIEELIDYDNFYEQVAEIAFHQQTGVIIADENLEYAFFPHILTQETKDKTINQLKSMLEFNDVDLEKSYHIMMLSNLTKDDEQEQEQERLVFVKKLSSGDYCFLSHQLESLESSIDAMNQFHIIAGSFGCLFGIFTTLIFASSFTKPIIEINKATQKMSQLDFEYQIEYHSQDELGQLANNINILSKTLDEYKTALKKEIEFQKILSQNMSHELKTPISVMKGYLEAISYGIAQKKGKQDEYISVVLHECEQMTELINQMLELSKLNNDLDNSLEKKNFTSQEFLSNIKKHHGSLLQQNNINFIEKAPEYDLWGNQELLVQGFGNFITNAVKYGDKKDIIFEIQQTQDSHILSLFNTGSQLQDDELTKIFDVFYMVDKARSRKQNSHGLGLTLSKSVALLHQGSVYCENKPNGIVFYLKIPFSS